MKVAGKNPFKACPVLAYFDTGREQVAGWCPFCRRWHYHGRGDGHRVAHCTNENSPFKEGLQRWPHGYSLKPVKLPPEVEELLVKRYIGKLTGAKLKSLIEECGATGKVLSAYRKEAAQ